MPSLVAAGAALARTLHAVPYDSAAPVLLARAARSGGRARPATVSGNCLHQAALLVEELRAEWGKCEIAFFRDGRHHAVLARQRGLAWVYLDPYLMQLDPVVLLDGARVVSRAAPNIAGRLGRLTVDFDGSRVSVTKEAPRGKSGFYVTHEFTGSFPDAVVDTLPAADDVDIAVHPEVTTLSLRVIHPSLSVVSIVCSLVERTFYCLLPDFVRAYPGDRRFDATLEEVACATGIAADAVLDYLSGARLAYDELTADRAVEYEFPNAINGGEEPPVASLRSIDAQ